MFTCPLSLIHSVGYRITMSYFTGFYDMNDFFAENFENINEKIIFSW